MPTDDVREKVREGYSAIAVKTSSGCCSGVSCCGSSPEDAAKLAEQIGYSAEQLAAVPDGANMGLSCGNPAAIASLQPGEVVLDLGSGGGFDVFIAGTKVGAAGRVIGVDMTAEMIGKARRNTEKYTARSGLTNVEFRLGEIEHLPVADNSVDVVISNCVLNLSPDKPQVWREIHRVLKPGGRIAISDMALYKPLPVEVIGMVEALIGCVSGAALVDETLTMVMDAGFTDIALTPKSDYVTAMANLNDPLYAEMLQLLPKGETPADYITSLAVSARK